MWATERRTIREQERTVSHRCSGHHGRQSSRSMEKWPHNRRASHGDQGSLPERGKRKASQRDECQANVRRPSTMDGERPIRKNGGDDNWGQRHGQTPSGGRGPAGLTCVTKPLCDLHLSTNQVGRRVCIRGQGAILCRRPQLGCDQKRCQPCRLDTREMCSKEHQVGKQMWVTVEHCKDWGGAVHAQTGPQETPPGKSDSNDKSRKRVHTIQPAGDTLAGRLDGRASDVQGAP